MVCVRANSSVGLHPLSLFFFFAAGIAVLFVIGDKLRLVAVGAFEWCVSAQTQTILRLFCGHSVDGGDCHGHGSNEKRIKLHCDWVVLEEKSKD